MSDSAKIRIGVLGSQTGTNFAAIADGCASGTVAAEVALVLTDVEDSGIRALAQQRGVAEQFIAPGKFRTKLDDEAEAAYVAALQNARVDWVVLAGFMRVLKGKFLKAFQNRVVNIHPSLLPSFPGLRAWEQAWEYGVKVSGCTVHLVDQGVDTGPILGQRTVAILDDDTPDTLQERIRVEERILYPEIIHAIASDRIRVQGRRALSVEQPGLGRSHSVIAGQLLARESAESA
ncbi:MAG: phosphoribosylglycinamide formyltransferase-1 [Limisphaerales bacterium]|jgi:phosphoribosylglycinamide formyltransferase-1